MVSGLNTGIRRAEVLERDFNIKMDIQIVKNVTYKDISDEQAIEIFNKYKDKTIFANSYNSGEWKVISNHKDSYYHLAFNELNKYKNEVKKFFLVRLDTGMNAYACASYSKTIITFLQKTHYLSNKYYSLVEQDIDNIVFSAKQKSEILMFFDFLNIETKYYELIFSLSFEENSRTLPNFYSILLFDSLMQRYIKEEQDKKLYDIVVLWWEITKVLPIRPIEFFTLQKDCILENDNKYYLKIQRAKQKYYSKEQEVPLLDKLRISKEQYGLVDKFIQKNNKFYENNNYLFNSEYYKHHLDKPQKYKNERDYIGSGELYKIFEKFFNEIICKKYGYNVVEKVGKLKLDSNEIERIQVGDTRHIAFINLLLSGVSAYTIAQIGGHTTISQQLSYYNHIEPYLSSKAYLLSRNIINGMSSIQFNLNTIQKYKLSQTQLAMKENDGNIINKIENGYCVSNNVPYDCIYEDCIYCPYCILDKNNNVLQIEKNAIKEDMKTKTEYLKKIISGGILENEKDIEIQKTINQLNAKMHKLSIIDAREQIDKEYIDL